MSLAGTFAPLPVPSLLVEMYGDGQMAEIFSLRNMVKNWLRVEAALARSQAALGLIDAKYADAIAEACQVDHIDISALIENSRNVGYPIFGLVRQIAAQLPEGPNGCVHLGATTQDIMDTGLAIQMRDAADLIEKRVAAFGDSLAELVLTHEKSVQAARTHAQQAVPTTFGAKLAVFLEQAAARLARVREVRTTVALLSLSGAGGTSAALGPDVTDIRRLMAAELGLRVPKAPWHVNRDVVLEFAHLCSEVAVLAVRFAREIVDLSRTEIAEVREPGGHHSGASSTMPQKVNPVLSEATIGFGVSATALMAPLMRAAEAGHERAAGEWQIEWHVVPQIAVLASSALDLVNRLSRGLQVFPDVMSQNLMADQGLLMAEAYMIAAAPFLGRERAHDLVYESALIARKTQRPLLEVLKSSPDGSKVASVVISPLAYLGEACDIARQSVERWNAIRREPS